MTICSPGQQGNATTTRAFSYTYYQISLIINCSVHSCFFLRKIPIFFFAEELKTMLTSAQSSYNQGQIRCCRGKKKKKYNNDAAETFLAMTGLCSVRVTYNGSICSPINQRTRVAGSQPCLQGLHALVSLVLSLRHEDKETAESWKLLDRRCV